MNALTIARAELAARLAGLDFPVHDHFPARIVTPCALTRPGDPYLEPAEDTFDTDEHVLTLELFAVAGPATNAVATDQLDTMLVALLSAIGSEDYQTTRVSAPFTTTIAGAVYLAAHVVVTSHINLNQE